MTSVYTPTTIQEGERFFTNLLPYLDTHCNVIAMSDFCCIWRVSHTAEFETYVDRGGKFLVDLVDKHFLIDVAEW